MLSAVVDNVEWRDIQVTDALIFCVPLARNLVLFWRAPDKIWLNFQVWALGARILGEVLECPFNKICERGSQWLITVTKKMCKCDVDDFGRATSQVQVFIWYIPIYSFGNIFIMYYKHLSNDLNAILNHYITKYLQKLKMTTKLWTFWSRAQCRFYGDTLASIVRNILRDEEKQIFWSDLSFIKWFLTKPVWHRGWRHYKAIAGNVLRDIGLFNQILIKMNKDIMKKFISASSDEKFSTAHNDVKIPLHPTVLNSASQQLAIVREQSGACIEKAASTVLPKRGPGWTFPWFEHLWSELVHLWSELVQKGARLPYWEILLRWPY